jgi:uncharacterized protein
MIPPRLVRALIALAVALLVTLVMDTAARAAFTPPPMTEPIVDPAGKLSAPDKAKLEDELSGGLPAVAMAVFIAPDLAGESIDDVGYDTATAWKLGAAGKDNGVLLVIAPNERKMRLEVGKGLEGDLPDLAANDILRQKVGPALKASDFAQAIAGGIDGVYSALHVEVKQAYARHDVPSGPAPDADPIPPPDSDTGFWVMMAVVLLFIVVILVFSLRDGTGGGGGGGGAGAGSGTGRAVGFGIGPSFLGGGGGGGDLGGGGGGGFSGGGSFGGGGSSDSY